MLGGRDRREPSPVEQLLGQLQGSVDRSRAEREGRLVPCERAGEHSAHKYVVNPASGVDFYCEGTPS
jgi:hypothetical protein